MRPPRVRTTAFPLIATRFTLSVPCSYWTLALDATLFTDRAIVSGSCPSTLDFASSFLQIPRRRGHPCSWLILPTAGRITNFHRLVVAHAGRTSKKKSTTEPTSLSMCPSRKTSRSLSKINKNASLDRIQTPLGYRLE